MDYISIIKRAYEITIKQKFLWIFGIFAGAGIGFGSYQGSGWTGGSADKLDNTNQTYTQVTSYIDQHIGVILLILSILLILGLLWFIMSVISRGALIGGIVKINKGMKLDFGDAFKIGTAKFWRILGTLIITFILVWLVFIILLLPCILLFTINIWWLAIIVSIIFILFFIVWAVFITFVSIYAQCHIVIEDKKVIYSFKESMSLVKKNWKNILLLIVFNWAVNIVISIVFVVVFLILLAILGIIGAVMLTLSVTVLIIYAIIFGLAFLVFMLIVSGVINTFNSCYWTLSYVELKMMLNK